MLRRIIQIFVFVTVCLIGEGGQFRYGLGRGDVLKVKIPAPPAIRIGRITLAIEVKDAAGSAVPMNAMAQGQGAPTDPTVPVSELPAALDQIFRESFTIVQSNGDALLRVAIVHYTPAESRQETVTQKSRVSAPPNPDGTAQIDPQTGRPLVVERTIAVEQWSARGQLSVRVEVVDSSGALIDGFAPQAVVRGLQ